MRLAAFDFGSNSIKCLIADVAGKQITEIRNLRAQNRLAKWLTEGVLPDAAIQESIALLQPLLASCRELGVQKMLAVGTEALRKASNSAYFSARILEATGIPLRVISHEEEAFLAWSGVLSGMDAPQGDICLFDSGGASTEFILGSEANIKQIISLALGAVSLSQNYLSGETLSSAAMDRLSHAIDATLQLPFPFSGRLIGTGGGVLACAKVALGSQSFDAASFDGYVLSHGELQRQLQLYKGSSIDQRKAIPGMEADRADIIPASALLFYKILEYFKFSSFNVSTRGLRHGLLQSHLCHL